MFFFFFFSSGNVFVVDNSFFAACTVDLSVEAESPQDTLNKNRRLKRKNLEDIKCIFFVTKLKHLRPKKDENERIKIHFY